jgi:hypothetical protein
MGSGEKRLASCRVATLPQTQPNGLGDFHVHLVVFVVVENVSGGVRRATAGTSRGGQTTLDKALVLSRLATKFRAATD